MSSAVNKPAKPNLAKFSLVGMVNTAVGYGVIFLAMALGIGPYYSNGLGYFIGLMLGFILTRNFVFQSSGALWKQGGKYIGSFLVAYATNLAALYGLLYLHVNEMVAQVLAGGVYFLTMFSLSKRWTFNS